jgi:hypothetical protein
MDFLNRLFEALGNLIVRLAGSRKSFFQLVSKIITIYLLVRLDDGWQIITVFGISTLADFVYFGVIEFAKVNTNVNIGK